MSELTHGAMEVVAAVRAAEEQQAREASVAVAEASTALREATVSLINRAKEEMDANFARLVERVDEVLVDSGAAAVAAVLEKRGVRGEGDDDAAKGGSAGGGERKRRDPRTYKRVFEPQPSLLTQMLAIRDYATIHNLFVTVVIMGGLNVAIADYFESGDLFNLSLIWWCFGQFDTVILLWFAMFGLTYTIIPLAFVVHRSDSRSARGLAIAAYVVLQVVLYAGSGYVVRKLDLPTASGVTFMLEQTRMSMKIHSYLRESFPTHSDDYAHSTVASASLLFLQPVTFEAWSTADEVGAYTYFMLAPTFIFRRSYPRNYRTRWMFVLRYFAELVGVVYFAYLVFRFVGPQLEMAANAPFAWKPFVLSVFSSMLPAMMLYIMAFWGLLHAWLNAAAEITRFADRRFYGAWWRSRSWGTFYRRWNAVVHEWIAAYLYSDSMAYLGFGRLQAQMFSFAVSAILHEYIVACALGFVYPVLLLMFGGPGVIFIALTANKAAIWNLFMWLMLALGNGLLLVLYTREWYAHRSSCTVPVFPDAPWMAYLPRSWIQDCSAVAPRA